MTTPLIPALPKHNTLEGLTEYLEQLGDGAVAPLYSGGFSFADVADWYINNAGSIEVFGGGGGSALFLRTPTVSAIANTTATLGATLAFGAGITARGTVWDTTPTPTANALAEGGTGLGAYTHARSGLPSATRVYFRGYATDADETAYSEQDSFETENTTQASAVNMTSVTDTGFTLGWTRGNGDGVLVLLREGSAVATDPQDGTDLHPSPTYSASADFDAGDGIGPARVVYIGTGTSVAVTGLDPSTTYHAAAYEYRGTNGARITYRSTPATASQATSATPIAVPEFTNYPALKSDIIARKDLGELDARARLVNSTTGDEIALFGWSVDFQEVIPIGWIDLSKVTNSKYVIIASGSSPNYVVTLGPSPVDASGTATAWDNSAGSAVATAEPFTLSGTSLTMTAPGLSAGDIIHQDGVVEFGELGVDWSLVAGSVDGWFSSGLYLKESFVDLNIVSTGSITRPAQLAVDSEHTSDGMDLVPVGDAAHAAVGASVLAGTWIGAGHRKNPGQAQMFTAIMSGSKTSPSATTSGFYTMPASISGGESNFCAHRNHATDNSFVQGRTFASGVASMTPKQGALAGSLFSQVRSLGFLANSQAGTGVEMTVTRVRITLQKV